MEETKFLIIGDGNAGATAAEELRKKDEDSEITILTDESEPLYNRIMLKNYMKGTLPKQYSRVHDKEWYEDRNIDLRLQNRVIDVNCQEKTVETNSGESFSYEKLLVATGGSPRKLPFDEGYDNIQCMWTMESAERVKESAENAEKAVVIGGGLLGIDLALAYAENGAETHYLIRGSTWWQRGLDEKGAEIIHRKLEEDGVNVLTNTEAVDFETENNEVTAAILKSGGKIECDAVGVAIGQTPNSEFIDVDKTESGMIKTNKFLETSEKDVFAAGGKVDYYSPVFERRLSNGAWDHSEEMGKTAANNMMSANQVFDYVNTYGVGHFDVQFLAVGDWSGESISRKYNENEYRRLFFDGDRLIGAVMIGFTKGVDEIRELIKDKSEFNQKSRILKKDYWTN